MLIYASHLNNSLNKLLTVFLPIQFRMELNTLIKISFKTLSLILE